MKWISLFIVVILLPLLVWITYDLQPSVALMRAANQAYRHNHLTVVNQRYLTVIDYTKSVFVERLWVIDLATGKTVLACHVSHALNSGLVYATNFNNDEGSEMSCLGSFMTQATYTGRFGYSLRVRGLDAQNSNTLRRSIVFHPCSVPLWSKGCWMTTPSTNKKLIDLIKNGSFVYVSL